MNPHALDAYYAGQPAPPGFNKLISVKDGSLSLQDQKTGRQWEPSRLMLPPPPPGADNSLSLTGLESAVMAPGAAGQQLALVAPTDIGTLRRELVSGVLELQARDHVNAEARKEASDEARKFETESASQVDMIMALRKELGAQERNYVRRHRGVSEFLEAANRETMAVNQRADQLRELAARLMAVGTEEDRRQLQRLGLQPPAGALSARSWLATEAQRPLPELIEMNRAGVLPSMLLYDTYQPLAPIDWPHGIEDKSHTAVLEGAADAWIGPEQISRELPYLRLVQLVTTEVPSNAWFEDQFIDGISPPERKLIVYRFLLVDRRAFGRRALIFDGVLLNDYSVDDSARNFKLRFWPSSQSSIYVAAPEEPAQEIRVRGVDSVAGHTYMGLEQMGSSNEKRLVKIAALVGQRSLVLQGREFAIRPAWSDARCAFNMPLEYGAGIERPHRAHCRVVGSYCGFRAVVNTQSRSVSSIEALMRERSSGQLVWTAFVPNAVQKMITEAATLDRALCVDGCACHSSLASYLIRHDRRYGAERIEQTIAEAAADAPAAEAWEPLARVTGVQRAELLRRRESFAYTTAPRLGLTREHADVDIGQPASQQKRRRPAETRAPEQPKKLARITAPVPAAQSTAPAATDSRDIDRAFLEQNELIALGANGEPGVWGTEVSRRRCSKCGMLGANNKGHLKPNHGQKTRISQAELYLWYASLAKEGLAEQFFRVQKKQQ